MKALVSWGLSLIVSLMKLVLLARGKSLACRRRRPVASARNLYTACWIVCAVWHAAVGLPFNPRALTWQPGERSEWRRSARWHVDVSVSSGFERRERVYLHTVENSNDLARFAAHHRPFYEQLYAQRLDVTPWEQDESS
jgi:hypothetical protein